MKKLILLVLLSASFAGCEVEPEGDLAASWMIVVENKTDKDILVSGGHLYTPVQDGVVIAPMESEYIAHLSILGASDSKDPLIDIFEEHHIDNMNEGPDDLFGPFDPFTMTIAGEPVSEDIWLRKYWVFTSNDPLIAYYTLTVTDELLASLTAAE